MTPNPQVKEGLAELHREENKVDEDKDKKLTFEQAQTAAKRIKKQFPVFSVLKVVDAGTRWDYEYAASSKKTVEGSGKAKILKWGNPLSRPTCGHTFLDHTQKLEDFQLIDRARELGHQIGQWTDDKAAALFIAEVAKKGEGTHNEPIPSGLGRSFLGDGTELPTDMARVVVKKDGSVRTAFPFNSEYPTTKPSGG